MNLEIDQGALKRLRAMGGEALVEQMVQLFLANTPKRIAAALEGEKAEDWTAVERAAHSMKSSAAHLGILGLQERAAQIEALAEEHRGSELRPLLEDVAGAFPVVQDLLERLVTTLPQD
jgi:HPt (histidine-containing phosphotransfer) domain-containing protein